MKDRVGNELHIGDQVAYILGASSSPCMEIGRIDKIYKNKCTIDSHPNIYANRTLLLKQAPMTENQRLIQSIEKLKDYCDNTPCTECKIEHCIKCAHKQIGQTAIPTNWTTNEIVKDVNEPCS